MTNPVKWLFSKEADEGCVPNRELVTYAAGMSGQSANGLFIKDYLLYYLTDVAGVESSFSGIITGLSKVWDAVNDPLVGAYIDNRKCADGSKFHSYLSRLPVIVGLFSCLIFFNLGLSGVPQIAVICAAYFLWDFFYSFQETAIWGTVSLMSPHAKERDRATQWIYIGANTGGAMTALVPLAMGIVKSVGIGEKALFSGFGVFYGFVCALISLLAAKGKERVDFEMPEKFGIRQYLDAALHNKVLLMMCIATLLSGLRIDLPGLYYFKYLPAYKIGGFELNGETALFIFNLVINISSTLGLFFSNLLAGKIGGMKNVLYLSKVSSIIFRTICIFVGFTSPARIIAVILLMSVYQIPELMVGVATKSLTYDAIDYSEYLTGERTEGISFALLNLCTKIATAEFNVINGFVLKKLEYNAEAVTIASQSAAFRKYIWPAFIAGPAIGAALYIIPLLLTKYNEKERNRIAEELSIRRTAVRSGSEDIH